MWSGVRECTPLLITLPGDSTLALTPTQRLDIQKSTPTPEFLKLGVIMTFTFYRGF
jgi:hypothetical protein